MKNLILLTAMLLSSVSVYATCYPTWGTKENPCECAYPILDSDGKVSCGPTYCPTDTVCMPNGACCKSGKECGTSSDKKCCSDTETCINGTTCCSEDKPYLDTNGNCVQCTDDSHCTEDGQTCDTSTGSCKMVPKTCTSNSQCASGEKCYNYSRTCIARTECCGPADACEACLNSSCYTTSVGYCSNPSLEEGCETIFVDKASYFGDTFCSSGKEATCDIMALYSDGHVSDTGGMCGMAPWYECM